ncbi:MAG: DsbA family oxidoreductase [Hyphomicrobiales bacterium]|nr:DsbA family oxidoreductase [Hyphomicrobiales bacterium]
MRMLDVSVVSDAICPWCFIGKRRLAKAAALLLPRLKIRVSWRPFQLNPGMPPGGAPRLEYRLRKFGSLDYSRWLDQQVATAGKSEGVAFRHDLMTRTPNTLNAHRVIWLSGREGDQDATVEAVFAAYFLEGRDIGEAATLAELAEAGGLPRRRTLALLASDEGLAEIASEERAFRAMGVNSVPSLIADGSIIVTGAAPPGEIASALIDAAASRAEA